MSNLTQNNISFNVSQYTQTQLTNRVSTASYNALLKDKYSYAVNAVEIDWNGAQIAGATLNTTGEMFSMLKTA